MQDKLLAPWILKEYYFRNAASESLRSDWSSLKKYTEFLGIDGKILGEPLGYGYWNLVFAHAEDPKKVIKLPSPWSPNFMKDPGEISKEIKMLSKHFDMGQILNPTVESRQNQNGVTYGIVIQDRLENFTFLDSERYSEDLGIQEQFDSIVSANKQMVKEAKRSYDFIGLEGALNYYISIPPINGYKITFSNVTVTSDNKLYLHDLESVHVSKLEDLSDWNPLNITMNFSKILSISAQLQWYITKRGIGKEIF